jgi:hypothetical protein
MKKHLLLKVCSMVLLSFALSPDASGQIICIYCYNQNAEISTGVNNLIQNGGFENGCNVGGRFCPNSSMYNCNITNWTCTGGGSSTYANVTNGYVQGVKAVYFGNYHCKPCSPIANDTSCLINTGCTADGPPAGYPLNTAPYGGPTGLSLRQTVSGLTPGNIYVLEFWAGGEAGWPNKGLFAVDVGFGDTLLRNKATQYLTGVGTRFIVEFIAASSSHTIKFTNWGHICTSCTELVLDDVKLYTLAELSSVVPPCNAPMSASMSNSTICSGGCTNVSAAAIGGIPPYTYAWMPNIGSGPGPFSVCPTTTTAYSVIVTDASGNTVTSSAIVTVNPVFAISLSSNTSICSGQSTTLNASGSASYSWSPATGLNTTTGNSVVASPVSTTTYTVTGTQNGCTSTSQVTVTVNPLPAISVSSASTSICAGQNILLAATGASTFLWSPSATLNASTGDSVIASPPSTTIYTVTGTLNGCTASAQITVTVNPLPVLITSPDVTVCKGDTTVLAISGANTYVWSPSTWLNSTTGDSVIAVPFSTTTYFITATDINGCTSTASITLTLNPTLTVPVPVLVFDTLFCIQGFVTYQWYLNTVIIPGATNYYHVTLQTGSYMVEVTDTNGCRGNNYLFVLITGSNEINLNSGIIIYPNPFSSEATLILNMDDFHPEMLMTVYDISGRVVATEKVNPESRNLRRVEMKITIHRNNLSAGMYFCTIVSGRKILASCKLLIE